MKVNDGIKKGDAPSSWHIPFLMSNRDRLFFHRRIFQRSYQEVVELADSRHQATFVG